MGFTATFYNYPYRYKGRRVFSPRTQAERDTFLTPLIITVVNVATPFNEAQGALYVEYSESLNNANYVKIVTAWEERFYFINNSSVIEPAEGETPTIEFALIEDVWATHFFKFDKTSGARVSTIEEATILQSTLEDVLPVANSLDFMQFNEVKKFLYDAGMDATPLFAENEKWCAVVLCSYPNGDERLFYQEHKDYTAAQESDLFKLVRTRIKSDTEPQSPYDNALVFKGYCIPSAIFKNGLLGGYGVKYDYSIGDSGGGFTDGFECLSPVSAQGIIMGVPGNRIKIELPANTEFSSGGKFVLSKKAIITKDKEIPFSWVGIANDTNLTRYAEFAISLPPEFSSENIVVYMFMDGERIDVSSSFEVSIKQNPAALQRAYNGDANNVLSAVAAGVGAIGGVVGGVASGNYFGAVQSVVSGTKYFTDVKASLATPELTRRGEANNNALWGFKGVAVLDYGEPNNAGALGEKIRLEGFSLRAPATVGAVNIYPQNYGKVALRVENADINGVENEAAQIILEDLKRGVLFDTV